MLYPLFEKSTTPTQHHMEVVHTALADRIERKSTVPARMARCVGEHAFTSILKRHETANVSPGSVDSTAGSLVRLHRGAHHTLDTSRVCSQTTLKHNTNDSLASSVLILSTTTSFAVTQEPSLENHEGSSLTRPQVRSQGILVTHIV